MTISALANASDSLDRLVALIQSVGVEATRNPEELQPPAAIIGAPTFNGGTLGSVRALVPVFFVVMDAGQRGVDDLLAMMALALPVLGTWDAAPTPWIGPLNPEGLPAYQVAVTITIETGS